LFFIKHSLNFSKFSFLILNPDAWGCPPKVKSRLEQFFIRSTLFVPEGVLTVP
ncbi:hypothetical protein LCGC14_2488580, partial [marine sediment metagenome]